MHLDLIARSQTEAYSQNVLNVLPCIAIEDACVNLNAVVLSTNFQSIVPVAHKALVLSGAENALTSMNDEIIKIRDLDGESDSDFLLNHVLL